MDDDALRAWYAANRRPLAVREVREPWPVLVLEVMSQQTQIERVGLALASFLRSWPDAAALAVATTRELLDGWAGLGYNRRALALREAARVIVERHDGKVPSDVAALEALPGIGPYTARAIAATAFGVPVAPVDVNVRRVLGRVVGGHVGARELQAHGDRSVWSDDPRGWVEAVMDVAALVCRPRGPRCDACPLATSCATAARSGDPARAIETVSRGSSGSRPPEPSRTSFPATRRWLRGEILRRLRSHPPSEWVVFDGPVGRHDGHAVREALASLERDGFLERHPTSDEKARLPAA